MPSNDELTADYSLIYNGKLPIFDSTRETPDTAEFLGPELTKLFSRDGWIDLVAPDRNSVPPITFIIDNSCDITAEDWKTLKETVAQCVELFYNADQPIKTIFSLDNFDNWDSEHPPKYVADPTMFQYDATLRSSQPHGMPDGEHDNDLIMFLNGLSCESTKKPEDILCDILREAMNTRKSGSPVEPPGYMIFTTRFQFRDGLLGYSDENVVITICNPYEAPDHRENTLLSAVLVDEPASSSLNGDSRKHVRFA